MFPCHALNADGTSVAVRELERGFLRMLLASEFEQTRSFCALHDASVVGLRQILWKTGTSAV